MGRTRPPVEEVRIGVASGRLRWTQDGDELVVGRYRIRQRAPYEWDLSYRGRPLELHTRRSKALAWAERHHRETQRRQQINRWTALSFASVIGAGISLNWLTDPLGFFLIGVFVWIALSAAARAVASVTRNLLDPYRTREKWEPSDWWNDNH